MRTKLALALVVVVVVACNKKKDDGGGGGGGTASGSGAPVVVDKPVTCPAGNAVDNGKCVPVVTPQKVAAVAQQQSRVDELAKLLDKVDTAGAPVELLDALRQLEQWKVFAATNDKAKMADEAVAALSNAVKTLRTFKASLGEVSGRLGNLKGELDKLLQDTGAAKQLAEVRTQISSQLRAALEPFAAQTADTIQNAIVPLLGKLDELGAMVDIACGTIRLTGGDKAKALCKDAHETFAKGVAYLEDFKARPAQLFDSITKELETQLDLLVDAEVKKLLDAAQIKVNDALKLPPPGGTGSAGSGSPAGSGSNGFVAPKP